MDDARRHQPDGGELLGLHQLALHLLALGQIAADELHEAAAAMDDQAGGDARRQARGEPQLRDGAFADGGDARDEGTRLLAVR